MNLEEVNKIRKQLLEFHLKDEKGNEIKRIAIPNPDDKKYEGCALKIKKTKLDKDSLIFLVGICKEHKLQMKNLEKGSLAIYTPKKS